MAKSTATGRKSASAKGGFRKKVAPKGGAGKKAAGSKGPTVKSARRSPGRKTKWSPPNYAVGTAIGRATLTLLKPGARLTVDDFASDLAGSDDPVLVRKKLRTAQRYLAALRVGVFAGTDRGKILQLFDSKGTEVPVGDDGRVPETRIREAVLADARDDDDTDASPSANALPAYLAFTTLQTLQAILPRDEVQELWALHVGQHLALGKAGLERFHRKFLAIPFGEKHYDRHTEERRIIDTLASAVLKEWQVDLSYPDRKGALREWRVEPLSLATYKSGLYLIGREAGKKDWRLFAIDRVEDVDLSRDGDEPVRFPYPKPAEYDPHATFEEHFGIFVDTKEKPVTVTLGIPNPQIAERLAERHYHRSQKFAEGEDGTWTMTMEVAPSPELVAWILGWGPEIIVLSPPSLRKEVAKKITATSTHYP